MNKKIMTMLAAALITFGASAQSTQEGVKMYNYRKWQSAERVLDPLSSKDPIANYYLGLSYLNAGDLAKANATFSKFPEDPANISGTARVAFAGRDVNKATAIAKGLAAKGKKKDWIQEKYAADAITYSEGGDYQQAITWYKDALTKTDDAEVHIGLGDAFRRIPGGGGGAMDNYEHVTEKEPNNSLAYSRIGDLWYEARNYQSALDNYAKAKNADSTNPLPYKALADAYSRSGRYPQALQNMQRYMSLSDNSPADQLLYTELLYNAKSYCDAAKKAAELLPQQTDPAKRTELYGILGYSQAECGDSVQALKNLRTYFGMQEQKKILPGDYIQYGKLFLKLDMLDSAGYYYAKGIAGDTAQNKTDVYRQIADAFKAKKEYCKSAEWYDNLIKANPESQPFDYAWRAIMFYYCKNLGRAATTSAEYAAKYPDQPSAFYWQARVASAIDSEATTGAAIPFFNKWLEMPGEKKPNDLKGAYEYMVYYYYNKKDKENMKLYKEKLMAVDPKDKVLHDIEEMEKAGSAPPKKGAPVKVKEKVK